MKKGRGEWWKKKGEMEARMVNEKKRENEKRREEGERQIGRKPVG